MFRTTLNGNLRRHPTYQGKNQPSSGKEGQDLSSKEEVYLMTNTGERLPKGHD